MPVLPTRPSAEYLRKQAKRSASEHSLKFAEAQRLLAIDYGFRNWAELIRNVESRTIPSGQAASQALFAAVGARDVDALTAALAAGANPRLGNGRETPLHAAARRGPLALVERLIVGGALRWQVDAEGRTALDRARASRAQDKAAIVALLDRRAIADPVFRNAVDALQRGDCVELARLIDAHPRILRERIIGPDAYRLAGRHDYFRDPKLFWFVANNPILRDPIAANIVDVARVMIERGVQAEDLDYALELTMSGSSARHNGLQTPLMQLLLNAGARVSLQAIEMAAGHQELNALHTLLASGYPMNAPIAAALGDDERLTDLIGAASMGEIQSAFGLAVLNGHLRAAEIALDAGAEVNASLPVHVHSTALHQAAGAGSLPMIARLLARGADAHARDTLWEATPRGWAEHVGNDAAQIALAAAERS